MTTPLLDLVSELLDERELTYTRHAELPLLMLRFTTDDGDWGTFLDVRERPPRLAIYSMYPQRAAAGAARAAMTELITRINHGLYVGNFELDLDDGAVRFKTSLELADAELTAGLFERLLAVNLDETARLAPIVAEVAAGTLTAADAVARAAARSKSR